MIKIVAHGTSEKVSEGATSEGDNTSVSVVKVGGYDSSASDCPSGADPVLPRTPIIISPSILDVICPNRSQGTMMKTRHHMFRLRSVFET